MVEKVGTLQSQRLDLIGKKAETYSLWQFLLHFLTYWVGASGNPWACTIHRIKFEACEASINYCVNFIYHAISHNIIIDLRVELSFICMILVKNLCHIQFYLKTINNSIIII